MNNDQKKKVAKSLYLSGYTNKHISKTISVTEKTIGKWVKDNKWGVIKAANESIKPEVISNLYGNIADIQEAARDEKRSLTASESDTIIKITNSIAKLENKHTLQVYIEIFKEYNEFLGKHYPKLLKPNNLSQNDFIQFKANEQ